jgi:hypothetical protein
MPVVGSPIGVAVDVGDMFKSFCTTDELFMGTAVIVGVVVVVIQQQPLMTSAMATMPNNNSNLRFIRSSPVLYPISTNIKQ